MLKSIQTLIFFIISAGIIIAADKEMKEIITNAFRDGMRSESTSSQTQSRETVWEENFEMVKMDGRLMQDGSLQSLATTVRLIALFLQILMRT